MLTQKTKDQLLHLYDWYVRKAENKSDYVCGYADAIGQCILDIQQTEKGLNYENFEAYKRVMQFENVAGYIAKYPKEASRVM